MSCLLIGTAIDSAFPSLNGELRSSTIEYARRKLDRLIASYNPWLCFSPVLNEIDNKLVYYSPPRRGDLIRDSADLELMASFLEGDGRPAIEELPGDYAAWLPSNKDISNNFDQAVSIIRLSDPVMSFLYDEIVDFVVPLGGGRNRGYSTHFARGAIFRSLPDNNNSYDVAIDIIHEVGHQVLMVWQSVDPILTSDPNRPIYSQIRRTFRPAIQSFHATVALAYMQYLRKAMPDDLGMQEAAARRGASYSQTLSNSLALAIDSLRTSCEFTDVGRKMIEEMENVV